MAADSCTLEIVNCTNARLEMPGDKDNRGQYQMNVWAFTNVGHLNYRGFPVNFFTGRSDEDDSAWQLCQLNGKVAIRLEAKSDDHSTHYFQLKTQGYADLTYLAAVTNASGTITEPVRPNDLTYWAVSGAASDLAYRIGDIQEDDDLLGWGLIDLAYLLNQASNPPFSLTTLWDDLTAGNLSAQEEAFIYSLMRKTFTFIG